MKIQENTERQKSQIEVGMHPARCIWFADLGLQEDTWEGKTSIKQKVLLGFEVAGQDFPIVKEYNASWAEKSNFGMDMVSWHGNLSATDKQEFDTKNLMEKECTLNIGLNSNGKPKIMNILPKTTDTPTPQNPVLHFEIQDFQEGSKEQFHAFPEWVRNKILMSKQLAGTIEQEENFDAF